MLYDEAQGILDSGGFLPLLKKFETFHKNLPKPMAESLENANLVTVGVKFSIDLPLLEESSSFESPREVFKEDENIVVSELLRVCSVDERNICVGDGIANESVLQPWKEVVQLIKDYFTLAIKFVMLHRLCLAFLNILWRGNDSVLAYPETLKRPSFCWASGLSGT